jgi:hypothetical protein
MTLKVEHLGEFESVFETALDHESGDQVVTSGEISFDKNLMLPSLKYILYLQSMLY